MKRADCRRTAWIKCSYVDVHFQQFVGGESFCVIYDIKKPSLTLKSSLLANGFEKNYVIVSKSENNI